MKQKLAIGTRFRNHGDFSQIHWLAALLLALVFLQAMTSIPRLSITFDEDVHITTGYSIWRTGDFRLVEDHPPLIELWMSWPLLLSPQMPDPEMVPAWEQGDRRLFARNEAWWQIPIDLWTIPARIPITWLALILGAFLYRWATDWLGPRAGLFALVLFALDPNILANATLATLDLGVTTLIFITMYCMQRFLHTASYRPHLPLLVASGFLLGLALSAKISAFILVPITVGLMVVWGWQQKKPTVSTWRILGWIVVYLGLAFMVLWGSYRFEVGPLSDRLENLSHIDRQESLSYVDRLESLSYIPIPMPSYVQSFIRVQDHVSTGDAVYLLNRTYRGGRWYFFPITFALKTPLPTLTFLLLSLIYTLRKLLTLSRLRITDYELRITNYELRITNISKLRKLPRLLIPGNLWRELVILGVPLCYTGISLFSSINLGYRHLLPILPFMFLFMAQLVAPHIDFSDDSQTSNVKRQIPYLSVSRLKTVLFGLLLLWLTLNAIQIWPFHLTFFNEIAGGSQNGYRYLADSNVDWGQGLKAVRDYLEAHNIQDANLSTFTYFICPELYGIHAAPLPPVAAAPPVLAARFNPAPGTYILSASTLRGLQTADPEMYNWFWHRAPDDVVGNAMLVYHVTDSESRPMWLAQCTVPAPPLSLTDIAEGFGRTDLRVVYFDCTQSWLIPNGAPLGNDGASIGWYVLHRDILAPKTGTNQHIPDPFIAHMLMPTHLNFEQTIPKTTPALTIYEAPTRTLSPAPSPLWAASAVWPPAQATTADQTISAPIPFDTGLTFLNYEILAQENGNLTLLTYWQVTEVPGRLFSLMAHLVAAEAVPLAVGDGFGISLDQLHPGDVVVQRHTFPLAPDLPEGDYWVKVGIYWLDDGTRWPITSRPMADAVYIPVTISRK
ncbi:MAG: glycosyltransferase family 39 protein [Anaerolineae bacterium]|nr:glycosyltransferase family 39 protein [Anaerolineae bacterium]